MSQNENITLERMIAQLAVIKNRLETFPFANHEIRMLRDCVLFLIRTSAGEPIPTSQLASIGGVAPEPQGPNSGITDIDIGGEIRRGGVEISPGVVQYPPTPATTPVHVEAETKMMQQQSLIPSKPAAPGLSAVPGSLMAMALSTGEQANEVEQDKSEKSSQGEPQIVSQSQQVPAGVPAPSDTKVEITTPENTN